VPTDKPLVLDTVIVVPPAFALLTVMGEEKLGAAVTPPAPSETAAYVPLAIFKIVAVAPPPRNTQVAGIVN
jgi:hypothetical protein